MAASPPPPSPGPDAVESPTESFALSADLAAATPSGRFTFVRPHAQGGLGRVSVFFDHQLQRPVALKEIRPEQGARPEVLARFRNEAEVTGQLEHPGVVPVYALESNAAGQPCYAMRLVQGQ